MQVSFQSVPVAVSREVREVKLRPAERVANNIYDSAGGRGEEGSRLPSVRQVAKHLGVSVATVQTVYRKLAAEGVIRSEVGSGSFWNAAERVAKDHFCLGINIPVPQLPSRDHFEICGGIMMAITQAKRKASLCPLPRMPDSSGGADLGDGGSVDGVVCFPSVGGQGLREADRWNGKPVVSVDPVSEASTSNFVSPDYYGASRLLVAALRRSGRRRIALVVNSPLETSVATRLRCAGAMAGLGERIGQEVDLRIYVAADDSEEAGRRMVGKIIGSGYRPDAIYCGGDLLVAGVLDGLSGAGVSVPEQVSVFGEARSRDCGNFTGIWRRMLLRRCDGDGADQPGVFLPVRFVLGGTTRLCENEILEDCLRYSVAEVKASALG